MQEFTTVFDILNEGYLSFMSFPIGWTSLAFLLFLVSLSGARYSKGKSLRIKEIGAICLTFIFVIVGIFASVNSYLTQKECINWAKNGEFEVVQGELFVTHQSNKREEFTVSGVNFSTSRHDGTKCGYKPQGIRDGRIVRISHREGCILKLEVVHD